MSDVTYKITDKDEELGHLMVIFSLGSKSYSTTFCDISLIDADSARSELERRAQGWADGQVSDVEKIDPALQAMIGKVQTVPEAE